MELYPEVRSGCPHDIKPNRVRMVGTKHNASWIAYCNACGEHLGSSTSKVYAERFLSPDDYSPDVALAYREWRLYRMPIMKAANLYDVDVDDVMLKFKEEDPRGFFLHHLKMVASVALAMAYVTGEELIAKARRRWGK